MSARVAEAPCAPENPHVSPPYRYLERTAGGGPFADLGGLARDILARRRKRGLRLVDHQLRWENPDHAGPRATVRVEYSGPDGEHSESLTALTAGEDAAALTEACRAEVALRRARAA